MSVADAIESVKRADFVAIDCEFSGIGRIDSRSQPAEYFEKLLETIPDYALLQIGICTVRRVPSTHEWTLESFNFYAFPDCKRIHVFDFQTIKFLRAHNFDFNAWADSGASYNRLASRQGDSGPLGGLEDILEIIIERNKPLIVHNGIFDICHLYDKFIESLPNSSEFPDVPRSAHRAVCEFACNLNRFFGQGGIFDTRQIAFSNKSIFGLDSNPNQLNKFLGLSTLHQSIKIMSQGSPTQLHLVGESAAKYGQDKFLISQSSPNNLSQSSKNPSLLSDSEINSMDKTGGGFMGKENVAATRIEALTGDLHEAGYDALVTAEVFILLLDVLHAVLNGKEVCEGVPYDLKKLLVLHVNTIHASACTTLPYFSFKKWMQEVPSHAQFGLETPLASSNFNNGGSMIRSIQMNVGEVNNSSSQLRSVKNSNNTALPLSTGGRMTTNHSANVWVRSSAIDSSAKDLSKRRKSNRIVSSPPVTLGEAASLSEVVPQTTTISSLLPGVADPKSRALMMELKLKLLKSKLQKQKGNAIPSSPSSSLVLAGDATTGDITERGDQDEEGDISSSSSILLSNDDDESKGIQSTSLMNRISSSNIGHTGDLMKRDVIPLVIARRRTASPVLSAAVRMAFSPASGSQLATEKITHFVLDNELDSNLNSEAYFSMENPSHEKRKRNRSKSEDDAFCTDSHHNSSQKSKRFLKDRSISPNKSSIDQHRIPTANKHVNSSIISPSSDQSKEKYVSPFINDFVQKNNTTEKSSASLTKWQISSPSFTQQVLQKARAIIPVLPGSDFKFTRKRINKQIAKIESSNHTSSDVEALNQHLQHLMDKDQRIANFMDCGIWAYMIDPTRNSSSDEKNNRSKQDAVRPSHQNLDDVCSVPWTDDSDLKKTEINMLNPLSIYATSTNSSSNNNNIHSSTSINISDKERNSLTLKFAPRYNSVDPHRTRMQNVQNEIVNSASIDFFNSSPPKFTESNLVPVDTQEGASTEWRNRNKFSESNGENHKFLINQNKVNFNNGGDSKNLPPWFANNNQHNLSPNRNNNNNGENNKNKNKCDNDSNVVCVESNNQSMLRSSSDHQSNQSHDSIDPPPPPPFNTATAFKFY